MKSELQKIPGVGKKMAQHLTNAGYPTITSLKGADANDVYLKDCLHKGFTEDKCALYCYRLAVCYADNDGILPPDKQNWWNWKD